MKTPAPGGACRTCKYTSEYLQCEVQISNTTQECILKPVHPGEVRRLSPYSLPELVIQKDYQSAKADGMWVWCRILISDPHHMTTDRSCWVSRSCQREVPLARHAMCFQLATKCPTFPRSVSRKPGRDIRHHSRVIQFSHFSVKRSHFLDRRTVSRSRGKKSRDIVYYSSLRKRAFADWTTVFDLKYQQTSH